MTPIALIHGYGAGSYCPPFGITQRDAPYNGFTAFKEEVEQGKAVVFKWYLENDFTPLQYLNVAKQLRVYSAETKLTEAPETIHNLGIFLNKHQSQIIVAFSLGSTLLFNYLNTHNPPNSLKYIITVQGDLSRNFSITNPNIEERFLSQNLEWINYYCPWDCLLPFSALYNKRFPIGLFGSKNQHAKNRFFPLLREINWHTATINDQKFRLKILELLKV